MIDELDRIDSDISYFFGNNPDCFDKMRTVGYNRKKRHMQPDGFGILSAIGQDDRDRLAG